MNVVTLDYDILEELTYEVCRLCNYRGLIC